MDASTSGATASPHKVHAPVGVVAGVPAEDVAVQRVLADKRRVAAVVVQGDVVEPRRDLQVLLAVLEHRRVGERHCAIQWRERVGARVVAVVEGFAVGRAVRLDVPRLGDGRHGAQRQGEGQREHRGTRTADVCAAGDWTS